MAVGLIPNLQKPLALAACRELLSWLELKGVRVCLNTEVAAHLQHTELAADDATMAVTKCSASATVAWSANPRY